MKDEPVRLDPSTFDGRYDTRWWRALNGKPSLWALFSMWWEVGLIAAIIGVVVGFAVWGLLVWLCIASELADNNASLRDPWMMASLLVGVVAGIAVWLYLSREALLTSWLYLHLSTYSKRDVDTAVAQYTRENPKARRYDSSDGTTTTGVPAHDPVIFMTHEQADEYYDRVGNCVTVLRHDHKVHELRGKEYRRVESRLKRFNPPPDPHDSSDEELQLLHAYSVRDDNQSCAWMTFMHCGARQTQDAHLARQAVLVALQFDAGDVLIRPEGVVDKFAELFASHEIDFPEHPGFSAKYFVKTKDEQLLRRNLPPAVLDALASVNGLLVRLRGYEALIIFDHKIRAADALQLARVGLLVAGCR